MSTTSHLRSSAIICGVLFSITPAFAQTCDEWAPIGDPAPRRDSQMVFDSDRNVAVMFGGYLDPLTSGNAYALLSETWEWNGKKWRFRTLAGPGARNYHAMAYDSVRHVTVVFGGTAFGAFPSAFATHDIWEWDGNTWTNRTPPSTDPQPASQNYPTMAFDAARGVTLLFGSADNTLWSWNGTAWSAIDPVGDRPPVFSTYPYMAYDSTRQVTVLVGNTQGVWEWNGTTWSHPTMAMGGTTVAPGASRFAYDPDRHVCIMHHGNGQPDYEWDGAAWNPSSLPGAPSLVSSAMAYDSARHVLLAFGGSNLATLSDAFNIRSESGWTIRASRPHPTHGYAAAMAFDSRRGVNVLFGGNATGDSQFLLTDETWELRGDSWTRRILPSPTPRAVEYAAMAYDPERAVCVLVGGQSTTVPGTTWEYDGTHWISRSTFSQMKHAMCYDPTRHGVLCFGPNRITTLWDGTSWTTLATSGAVPDGTSPSLTFNGATNLPTLYGGQNNSNSTVQLLAGNQWQFLSPSMRPQSYWAPAAAYDPERNGIVVFGGFGGSSNTDVSGFARRTYLYANGNWSFIGPTYSNAPGGRKYHVMDYDSTAHRVVMHGGFIHSTQAFNDTWKLARGPAAIEVQPADTTVAVSQTLRLALVASGGGGIDYQWKKNGVALDDDGRITGAYTDTLVINNAIPSDGGTYECIVSNRCGTATTRATVVTTRCVADYDDGTGTGVPDGGVDISDLLYYLGLYENGDARADVDDGSSTGALDGGVTIDDLLYNLARFSAGC